MAAGTETETEILIVGAGPTGLLAAALLARLGIAVRIVDRAPEAAKESRAFGIQARSLELFASIGLAETLLDRGLLATGVQVFIDGERRAEIAFDDLGRTDTPFGFLLMVPQSEIEAVLVEDLARLGVAVERGWEALDLKQDAERATVRLRGPDGERSVHARYAIGADGAHSRVRKALGLSFEGGAYAQTFLLADATVTWPLAADRLSLFVRGRDFAAFLPLKGRDYARVMVVDPEGGQGGEQGSAPVDLAVVEQAFRQATGLEASLSSPRWTSRYRVHHRGVDRYRIGRAFVAGDAAHIHSPAGGQGMNTGLQDVANLCWKLALVLRGAAADALLDSYHDERWPVGQRVLAYTDRAFSAVTEPSGWTVALRSILAPSLAATLSRVAAIRRRAFGFVSQLGIRYAPGRFAAEAAEGGWSHGPGPGHRAPNAAIARRLDVFDLLAGYRFTLLAFSRDPLAEEEIAALRAELDALERNVAMPLAAHLVAHSLVGRDPRLVQAEAPAAFASYGIDADRPRGLYLVRPDGYVAWRTDRLDIAACRAFLRSWAEP